MLCLWLFRGSCVSAVTVTLVVLSSALALVGDSQPCFMLQMKYECGFSHGAQQVRYVERHFYNRREFLRFHSDVGEFQALTELGRLEAEAWNKQKDKLEDRRAAVDTFCRYNYLALESFVLQWRSERGLAVAVPQVTVYPAKTQPLQHHNLLVCAVSGFYPGSIQVRWFRSGEEEEAGVVSTGLIRNGDWTFQTLVMLETVPESGEVYSCHVEHPSVSSPVIVKWKPQSGSAQTKMLSGVGGLVLGLLFQGLGLLIYFRSQKRP
ncbi:HLA class II histocompatibility antigen, DRB1 beta chain-like [Ochotona curzoniae]|uniref:HLA class II histocompatibility antigen, DRB1 beta chain-like n=1 Tax=Ochotona curzoniae TaxID=130825 RepID=UPI001B34E1C9|nr:HLA class II histocompatibility antigen, DRB1 beta chain-like [Ochotona curzoniae]